jgi:hypothetical protein
MRFLQHEKDNDDDVKDAFMTGSVWGLFYRMREEVWEI